MTAATQGTAGSPRGLDWRGRTYEHRCGVVVVNGEPGQLFNLSDHEPHVCPSRKEPSSRPQDSAVPVGRRLSQVAPERMQFLWPGYVPSGKVTILDGDPGLGKTLVALDIAARVLTARTMPDGSPGASGGVVMLTAEDDPADTIRPRMDALTVPESALERFIVVETIGVGVEERLPELAGDRDKIAAAVREVGARLLIIDPIVAYLGDANGQRDQDVRRVLAHAKQLAQELDVAVLLIRHLNKSGGSNAKYRGGGSIGFIAAARAGLMVVEDADDPGHVILAQTKSNVGAPMPSLRYRIEEAPNGAAVVVWEGQSDWTASSLLARAAEQDNGDRREIDEAVDFLRGALAEGPRAIKDVRSEAAELGFSNRTLDRAKKQLGAVSERLNDGGSRGAGRWLWLLPDVQVRQVSSDGGLAYLNDLESEQARFVDDVGVLERTRDSDDAEVFDL